MIFNVPNHIQYIRNGLFRRFINSHGVPAAIIKTQTRRLNRGIYKLGKDYAVQCKRGMKAEPDIRIVMDRIWKEKLDTPYAHLYISEVNAKAEGGYIPEQYETLFREINPKWDGFSRWVFEFHAIEVRK